jgi:hypothetical protein
MAVAAARRALADAGRDGDDGLGMVVGSELGDLASTITFVDGYLRRGPQGLSALLFPNTVMNTMAATTIAVTRAPLTLNAPNVAGETLVRAAGSSGPAAWAVLARRGRIDPLLEKP